MPERVPIRMWLALPGSTAIHAIDAVVRGSERAGNEAPVLALVGRLVEAEAGLAVPAAVRFARADVERLARRVVRVDGDGADRVRRDVRRDLLPVRLLRERVLRAPDAAAGRADVQRAVLLVALRAHRHRRHAARPLRRLDERLRAESVDVERVRADLVPLGRELRPFLLELGVRLDRALDLGRRDLRAGIRAVGVLLGGRAVRSVGAVPARARGRFRAPAALAELRRNRRAVGRRLAS